MKTTRRICLAVLVFGLVVACNKPIIDGGFGAEAALFIDGQVYPERLASSGNYAYYWSVKQSIDLDPGTHTIEVAYNSGPRSERARAAQNGAHLFGLTHQRTPRRGASSGSHAIG